MLRFVLEVFFFTKRMAALKTLSALKRLEASRLSKMYARHEQFNQKKDISLLMITRFLWVRGRGYE